MLKSQKTYEVEFLANNSYFFIKDGKLQEIAGESFLGEIEEFPSSEEALDFVEKNLEEKMSSFAIIENKDDLEEFEEILKSFGITLENLDIKRVILLKQRTMQLILNRKVYVDIPDIKLMDYVLENIENILLRGYRRYKFDTEYSIKEILR